MARFLINLVIAIVIIISVWSMYLEASASYSEQAWTKQTYSLHNKMQELGMGKDLAEYIINNCKAKSDNPRRCVVTASMISKAESNMGKNAYKNNVWGINEGKTYPSVYANFDRWLKSYLKYWYKSPLPHHYYPAKGNFSKTRYCYSEESSNSKIGCPFGLKHATYVYNILNSF